jgi:hypothetical protein
VTSDATDAPIRHTVSCVGTDADDDDVDVDDPPADELLLELQPAIASAATVPNATSAAGVFLSPTAGTPFGWLKWDELGVCVEIMTDRRVKLTGNFPIR